MNFFIKNKSLSHFFILKGFCASAGARGCVGGLKGVYVKIYIYVYIYYLSAYVCKGNLF